MEAAMNRLLAALVLCVVPALAQTVIPLQSREGDYIARNFKFTSGETLPELRLHYTTLGKPLRDAAGRVTNAVLILHGTGGDGHQFFRPQFADVLFKPGGLLDPAHYYVILPDDIGHGKSSKPSDGLHARFPHYGYVDMVEGEYLLVTKGLRVDHLRLVMGTSMGCMHSFMWGEEHPGFVDALMPLACLPVEIAGRNRMWRKMIIDAIEKDPAWKGGAYKTEPQMALRTAADILVIAGSAPLPMQLADPTAPAADKALEAHVKAYMGEMDANDLLYQVASSRDYDPSKDLGKITADVMWVNSSDDFINPPDLGIAEREAEKLKHGRFVLIPGGPGTHGHGTHTWAAVWQGYLAQLLKESAK
ncbi:MAG: alpha/beta fold hydrolase [Alphaproteobacteria bacterium]|nr:alpha/beta fold hydrolase [Alphaproteobacteria bacterium]MDE2112131.1 alpha/beta fold hydrolase [Alphaproteobacteria bacterium]MDE2493929.1 alpha/beta fold hydrolase [Alphaproteobacteria bacterium]